MSWRRWMIVNMIDSGESPLTSYLFLLIVNYFSDRLSAFHIYIVQVLRYGLDYKNFIDDDYVKHIIHSFHL
jgi:hypothetical protein